MQIVSYNSLPKRPSCLGTAVAWLMLVTLIGIAFIVLLGWWVKKQEAAFQNSRWQYYQAHPETRIHTPTPVAPRTAATTRR